MKPGVLRAAAGIGLSATLLALLPRSVVDTGGVGWSIATAYALVVHSVLFVPVILVGGLLLCLNQFSPAGELRVRLAMPKLESQ